MWDKAKTSIYNTIIIDTVTALIFFFAAAKTFQQEEALLPLLLPPPSLLVRAAPKTSYAKCNFDLALMIPFLLFFQSTTATTALALKYSLILSTNLFTSHKQKPHATTVMATHNPRLAFMATEKAPPAATPSHEAFAAPKQTHALMSLTPGFCSLSRSAAGSESYRTTLTRGEEIRFPQQRQDATLPETEGGGAKSEPSPSGETPSATGQLESPTLEKKLPTSSVISGSDPTVHQLPQEDHEFTPRYPNEMNAQSLNVY